MLATFSEHCGSLLGQLSNISLPLKHTRLFNKAISHSVLGNSLPFCAQTYLRGKSQSSPHVLGVYTVRQPVS